MGSSSDDIKLHGWTAIAADATAVLQGKPFLHEPQPLLIKDIEFPSKDKIVSDVQALAREKLSGGTYNHSMRVFYYAMAILRQQFPEHASSLSPSTLALTSLLHDIGATSANIASTQLSFEFWGGIYALNLLQHSLNAPQSQAEAVAEAIIRHQDIRTTGKITFLGQLIQLATIYDNVSNRPELVHEVTRVDVNKAFPRNGWSKCFHDTILEENRAKPWAHTTSLGEEEFPNSVLGNKFMAEYDSWK